MDLIQTTLEVVENRNALRENLTIYKQNFQQYEEYINKLKENLQEALLENSRNKEILEMNNFTKNVFNENCKRVKHLFGQIYKYVQQIDEKLSAITNQETSLDETYNENEERCKHLEKKFNNTLHLLAIVDKNVKEKSLKESSDAENEIHEFHKQFTKLNELWKKIIAEHDEKSKKIESIKVELDILNDEQQSYEHEESVYLSSMKDTHDSNQNVFEKISRDIKSMDDVLEKTENSVFGLSEQLKTELYNQQELMHHRDNAKANLIKLKENYLDTENVTAETEKEFTKKTKKLVDKIEFNQHMLKRKENELGLLNNKKMEISNEKDGLEVKIHTLTNEIHNLKTEFEAAHDSEGEIISKIRGIKSQYEGLIDNYEKLSTNIETCKNNMYRKEQQLQLAKTSQSAELIKIQDMIKMLEFEYSPKKQDAENEIQKSESQNKQLQQTIEELEPTLKDLENPLTQRESNKDQYQNQIKSLTHQCDLVSNDIKRQEAEKKKRVKITPTPPLQHFPRPQPKKRSFLDTESDNSSVDGGERLTYAEFMARKKMGRESKKPKRVPTKPK